MVIVGTFVFIFRYTIMTIIINVYVWGIAGIVVPMVITIIILSCRQLYVITTAAVGLRRYSD